MYCKSAGAFRTWGSRRVRGKVGTFCRKLPHAHVFHRDISASSPSGLWSKSYPLTSVAFAPLGRVLGCHHVEPTRIIIPSSRGKQANLPADCTYHSACFPCQGFILAVVSSLFFHTQRVLRAPPPFRFFTRSAHALRRRSGPRQASQRGSVCWRACSVTSSTTRTTSQGWRPETRGNPVSVLWQCEMRWSNKLSPILTCESVLVSRYSCPSGDVFVASKNPHCTGLSRAF